MALIQTQKEKKTDEYDHTCTSVSDCAYLQRLCKALQFYQSNEASNHNELLKYFAPENYNLLLTDYHHILYQHLDNKPIIEIQKEFELIHHKIMKYIKQCSLEKCKRLERNHRTRDKHTANATNNDTKIQFYIDTMDTIHCYFIHSFDLGFRLKADEISTFHSVDENDEKKDDSYLYKDTQMKQLKNVLNIKRKKLSSTRG
eukprot:465810_1